MKALSILLSALWVLCSLTQPASAQSNSTPSTGILTEDEYNKSLAPLPFSCPNHTNASCNCLVNAWKAIIGKSIVNSITTISQTDANQYLKDKLFNNGLLDDVKKLTHWPKDKDKDKDVWDAILSKRAIVLRTAAYNPETPSFNAASTCDHISSPKKPFLYFLFNQSSSKKEDIDFNQILNIYLTKMEQKKRWCFKDGGIDSSDASLRTTLVHEMGHQYLLANYPDLHFHKGSDPELVEKLVIMCQEAFAVYTEYQYLKHLAENSKMKSGITFDFKNFLDDAYSNAKAVQAGNKYTSLYGVDLAYMYYFLCGLDWDGEPDESGCPPFNYLQLEKIAKLCRLMRENKLDTSNIPPLKIDEDPFLIELNMSYASSNTQLLATYAELEKRIAHIFSSQKEILTRFLPKNAEAIRQQLASNIKIKSPADLQAIVNLTSQIPDNKPAHMTDEEYTIYLQEEYKKVSPDIRKQTFQVMLEYLSANQYMK